MRWPWTRKTKVENQALDLNDDKLYDIMTSLPGMSSAGVAVNEQTAMKFSAVYSCVSLLSRSLASMDCQVYTNKNGHNELVTGSRLVPILNRTPNQMMTGFVFWEAMALNHLLSGNGYAIIARTKVGDPRALIWVPSQLIEPRLNAQKTRLLYKVTADGKSAVYDQDDILHIPALGWDGVKGMSPISAATEGIGLGIAGEKYNAHFFTNAITSDIAISYDKPFTPEARKELEAYLVERYSNLDNLRKPFIGTNGAKVVNLGMSASDAQMIEARDYQVEDICRFYGVPPFMVGAMKKNTSFGAGLAEQMQGFVKLTLRPMVNRFEQEIDRKLIRDSQRLCKFNLDALLRADIKIRNEAYRVALGGNQVPGYMSQNDIRRLEGLPPDPDPKSDELYRPPVATTEPTEGAEDE